MTAKLFILACGFAANTALMVGFYLKNHEMSHVLIGVFGYLVLGILGALALQ